MSRIPQEKVEEVLERTDVIKIIERYTQVRRSGSKYVALCPFHNEKTPSLSIDPDKGLWYCFGCKEGGSIVQFLMKIEALNYGEAMHKLADEAGIVLEVTPEASAQDAERTRALELLERACAYYQDVLHKEMAGAPGRQYMSQRGVSRKTALDFRLGWAPEGGEALLRVLREAGFKPREAVDCGVAVEGQMGTRDLLRGRLVFPICDAQGRILAFGGRALGDAQPKYLNSPETRWYSKRRHLYGLNLARGHINKIDKAVLVEGYFDVVSMHQAGANYTVASLGTSLTAEQAQLLHRYASSAVIAYDADRAGQMATLKGSAILEEAGLRVFAAVLPPGQDPDNLAAQGLEAVQEVLNSASGIVDFQIRLALAHADLSTPEGKEDFIKAVFPYVERIRDSVRQDAYICRLAYYAGVSETKLHWRLRRRGVPARTLERRITSLSLEERLLQICAANPQWIPVAAECVIPDMISDASLRPFFQVLLQQADRIEPLGLRDFVSDAEDSSSLTRLAAILSHAMLESSEDDVRKLAGAIRDRALRAHFDELREQVMQGLQAGTLRQDDPLYEEYRNLCRHFHGRG